MYYTKMDPKLTVALSHCYLSCFHGPTFDHLSLWPPKWMPKMTTTAVWNLAITRLQTTDHITTDDGIKFHRILSLGVGCTVGCDWSSAYGRSDATINRVDESVLRCRSLGPTKRTTCREGELPRRRKVHLHLDYDGALLGSLILLQSPTFSDFPLGWYRVTLFLWVIMDARGRRIHATIHHPFSLGPLGSSSIRLTGRLGLDSSPEANLESFDRYEVLNAIGFCSSICKVSFK